MKQIALFVDTDRIKTTKAKAKVLVEIINHNTDLLNDNGFELSTDDLQLLSNSRWEEVTQRAFLQALQIVCDRMFLDFDVVNDGLYIMTDPMPSRAASKMSKPVRDVLLKLRHILTIYPCSAYIEITNNKARLIDNVDDLITYDCTLWGNEKQAEACKLVEQVIKIYKKLKQCGYDCVIDTLINNAYDDVDYNNIMRYQNK